MDLSKVGDRERLKAQREPHWQRLRAGCFLGFRPSKRGGKGTWIARAYDDDAGKYRVMRGFFARSQPPTNDTFQRAAAWDNFTLHLGEGWTRVAEEDGAATVETPKGRYAFDFLVLSTGLVTDPRLRPELAGLADDILRWRDRYAPPADANPLIDAHPYLGQGFEVLGRDAAASARVHGLFAFNYSALISLGLSAAALSGLKYAVPRLVEGVARQLFLDDADAILADYEAYAEREFVSEWSPRSDVGAAA